MAPGEFCVRGGLVDLFPTGSPVPYRLDLLGEEIESIRTFDVDSQRSIYPVAEVRLLPAREFPLDDEGRARFRANFRERFEGDPTKRRAYKDVSNGIAPPGVECYLPLFFESTSTLFDYLPAGATFVMHEDVPAGAEAFWRDLQQPLGAAARRQRPAAPAAGPALPAGRGVLRRAAGRWRAST